MYWKSRKFEYTGQQENDIYRFQETGFESQSENLVKEHQKQKIKVQICPAQVYLISRIVLKLIMIEKV